MSNRSAWQPAKLLQRRTDATSWRHSEMPGRRRSSSWQPRRMATACSTLLVAQGRSPDMLRRLPARRAR